ncbi:hypothetical protein SERLA73DRAFT_76816 [Serpula lacrymans var. lacrymans S7.3]|uniref:HNH nuclease domain-containing protein n=1 Tax=Serpula lacrymans var. lacrymans (strain S7.3) TaxID=936435 RepID=F8Q862_SERL3|nr:hypothetical protein SERLA73DRAFT_76816 [Serpula lacrymans var. lacrymans S7.3]
MPQPLPQRNPFDIDTQARYHNAYACLTFEAAAAAYLGGIDSLVLARVPGYIALTHLSEEIVDDYAMGLEALTNLGLYYINAFIRAFRTSLSAVIRYFMTHISQEAPKDHQTAKPLALIRDNYQCAISGAYDWSMADPAHEAHASFLAGQPTTRHRMRSYHSRLREPQYQWTELLCGLTVWTVLSRLGLTFGWDELLGNGIHRIENVMTLCFDVHLSFDNVLWLDPTASNTTPVPQPTTPPSPLNITRPDPRYLKLHAMCCKVAHLSGAGESINKIHRDMEDMSVLAKDGSSMDLLNYKLATPQTLH